MRNALKTAALVSIAALCLAGCNNSEAASEPPPPPPVYKITQKTIDGRVTFEDRLVIWGTTEHGCVRYRGPSDPTSGNGWRYVCGGLITIVPE